MEHPERVALIGAGAVGTALAVQLVSTGYHLEAVISRTSERAARLATRVQSPLFDTSVSRLPVSTQVVFCCVPDDCLPRVIEALAELPYDWSGRIVVHTSGALSSDVWKPLADRGALPLSFHPVQTFVEGIPTGVFSGICIGLEGVPAAVSFGERLARQFESIPLVIAPEHKVRYHLAVSMASNFFVVLMDVVDKLLGSIGIPDRERMPLIRPLIERTWSNVLEQRAEQSLTGPIARGDLNTVQRHIEDLVQSDAGLLPLYVSLARQAIALADRSGRLSTENASRLEELMNAAQSSGSG